MTDKSIAGRVKHKHAEVIKAWADGIDVQRRGFLTNGEWRDLEDGEQPNFFGSEEWRVKPEKVYPETQMTHGAMFDIYAEVCRSLGYKEISAESSGLAEVGNAVLRHAIDVGQVAAISEAKPGRRPHNPYTGQLRDPRDIETDPMGVAIYLPGEPMRVATPTQNETSEEGWIEIAGKRAARDMAIAEAVRDVCHAIAKGNGSTVSAPDIRGMNLAAIIAKVRP